MGHMISTVDVCAADAGSMDKVAAATRWLFVKPGSQAEAVNDRQLPACLCVPELHAKADNKGHMILIVEVCAGDAGSMDKVAAATRWFFMSKPGSQEEAVNGRLLLACMHLLPQAPTLLADFCSHALGLGEHLTAIHRAQ